jgi:hypothetical protein
MVDYTMKVQEELHFWKRKMTKRSGLISRTSKKAQMKVNGFIPEKFHKLMTESIKNMVKATLVGSNITTKKGRSTAQSLYERDE